MSDEGPDMGAANGAARDGGDSDEGGSGAGRTAVVTEPAARPQRPSGKRSRQRAAAAGENADVAATEEVEVSKEEKAKKRAKTKAAKKPRKPVDRPTNPFLFVYNYLKQVVAEMRKVIWPNRKQMLTYTSVVLVFLAFMVALVGLADLGLTKLVLLVFG
ncbi:preprotein translocase subunit SecE [Mycobacterium sp.]|uniref:preprotein translocase subunit SecE n=1 Tax=Mycobacterium sp. TaxID=1785 RepID=UPI0025E9A6AF|nr:preprotein translocase subunit SecE [Mycobacterium sp.]MBW0012589.1 preprotein translocase subunit SecE [Mycobacterium sp.]